MAQKNTSRGAEVTKHNIIRTPLDDIEYKQFDALMKHYGFVKGSDLVKALIKRASLSVLTK